MDKSPESFQWLVLFALYALAFVLLSQLNQSLTTVSLYLFINGLVVTFPALFLPLGQGMATVFLTSLFYDAGESWSFGTSLIPNLIIFTIIFMVRDRIQYNDVRVHKLVVLIANLILFLFYTVLALSKYSITSQLVFLNLVHLLVSELVLLMVAGWLIFFQKDVLRMFNVDVDAALRTAK